MDKKMLYAHVTPEEYEQLVQTKRQSKNVREHERLHIIQLSSQGKNVPELAKLFGRCTATIRDYIERYNQGGLNYLNLSILLSWHYSDSASALSSPQASWDTLESR